MTRWSWLLVLPYVVVFNSKHLYEVNHSTISVTEQPVLSFLNKEIAYDMAEALNAAHKRRTSHYTVRNYVIEYEAPDAGPDANLLLMPQNIGRYKASSAPALGESHVIFKGPGSWGTENP